MIQVDMFEVQLGASLLLQFKARDDESVRVLADAGEGPPVADVHAKLAEALDVFGHGERRIDLLIGTHYDADHLDGLVPIINDRTISITEAWLPPVANDVEPHAFDESLADHHLLANQLYSRIGRQMLRRYLEAKREICARLRPRNDDAPASHWSLEGLFHGEELNEARRKFEEYRGEALHALGTLSENRGYIHADDNQFDPTDIDELLALPWRSAIHRFMYRDLFLQYDIESIGEDATASVTPGSTTAYNLAGIRKSAACDAINAISLAKVVEALRARHIPTTCQVIPDGSPRRFVWRSESRRFEGGAALPAQGPEILLLGPSESLVKKHWNRLPIGTYAAFARLALIPTKSITPSNQLSYVARFGAEEQGILVTGDAGCVDFRPNRNEPYFRNLLGALLPLHVVQVAHHAGNNAHFYRVLQAVKYPERAERSFLLVSHATDDIDRPSREFRQFVQDFRQEPDIAKILFTTKPTPDKIHGYESLVHTNVGPVAREGDVRLEFRNGTWNVAKHAIKV